MIFMVAALVFFFTTVNAEHSMAKIGDEIRSELSEHLDITFSPKVSVTWSEKLSGFELTAKGKLQRDVVIMTIPPHGGIVRNDSAEAVRDIRLVLSVIRAKRSKSPEEREKIVGQLPARLQPFGKIDRYWNYMLQNLPLVPARLPDPVLKVCLAPAPIWSVQNPLAREQGSARTVPNLIFMTRSDQMGKGNLFALHPGFDIANHGVVPNVQTRAHFDAMQMKTIHAVDVGEPLLISYGRLSSPLELVERYGFLISSSDVHGVDKVKHRRFAQVRERVANQNLVPVPVDYELFSGVPECLISKKTAINLKTGEPTDEFLLCAAQVHMTPYQRWLSEGKDVHAKVLDSPTATIDEKELAAGRLTKKFRVPALRTILASSTNMLKLVNISRVRSRECDDAVTAEDKKTRDLQLDPEIASDGAIVWRKIIAMTNEAEAQVKSNLQRLIAVARKQLKDLTGTSHFEESSSSSGDL